MAFAPATAGARGAAIHVTRVSVRPGRVAAGDSVKIAVGLSGRPTRAARITLLLSRDARRDRGDTALGAPLRLRLRARAATAARTVARATRAGTYRVLACVARRCRASAPLRVLAPPAGATGALPSIAPASGAVPAPGPGRTLPAIKTVPDGPVNGTVTPGGGSVTKTIGTSGGSLTTTDEAGRGYTLTFPANAVPDGTDITMTPIAAIGGTPLDDRFTGGVILGPDGLQLIRPATLTITDPGGAPGEQLAFLADGTGNDLHAVPVAGDPTVVTMQLTHFTLAGTATDADGAAAAAMAQHPPQDPRDQLEQDVALLLRQAQRGEITSEDAFRAAIDKLDAYRKQVLDPKMAAHVGYDDDATATAFIKDLLTWSRTVQLLGGDGSESTFFSYIGTLVERSYQRHQDRCRNGHHVADVLVVADRNRTLQLLGDDGHPISEVLGCLGFQLRVTSHATWTANPEGDITMQGTAPLTRATPFEAFSGSASFSPQGTPSYTHHGGTADCPETLALNAVDPSTLTVSSLNLLTATTTQPVRFDVRFDPGAPQELYTFTSCNGVLPSQYDTQWRDAYDASNHVAGLDANVEGTVLHLPSLPLTDDGTAVVAHKVIETEVTIPDGASSFTVHTTTTVDVIHDPA